MLSPNDPEDGRWSAEDARAWQRDRPWICGFNFLPSTAVNFLELWHADSFDEPTIRRELGWAAGIGFNALRVNLHYLVWKHDRDGLMDRIDRFLWIASGLGLATVLCPFDDCEFSGEAPVYGPQPAPRPGIHNSRAVASPGRDAVMNRDLWPDFLAFLSDVVGAFRDDPRVLFWDLYNEPGNRMIFTGTGLAEYDAALEPESDALMRRCFAAARACAPTQPLTVAGWRTPSPWRGGPVFTHPTDLAAFALSDIVTFHAYCTAPQTAQAIAELRDHGRPMLCTEWMARHIGSRIEDQLPLFHQQGVGAFQWGLVRGRTQTTLPWPQAMPAQGAETPPWFHDLLDSDGQPYDPQEVETIRRLAATPG